jgi:hypothetical protein
VVSSRGLEGPVALKAESHFLSRSEDAIHDRSDGDAEVVGYLSVFHVLEMVHLHDLSVDWGKALQGILNRSSTLF